jgi:alpha-beta hydrolase superfamily lysophospholipase
MTVLSPDRRGSGTNQQERGHCENAGQLLEDIDTAVEWLKEHSRLPQVDIVAVSWSGKLGLAYVQRFAEKVRSLVLVGPGLCPKIDISLKEKISVGLSGLVNPHKLYAIPLTEPTLFTSNPPMLEFLARDPLMLKEVTASFFIASKKLDFQARQAVGKLKLPVSLFLAERDRIVDNQATIDFLKEVLTPHENLPQGYKIYRKAQHTLDFEPEPQVFFSDLAQVLLAKP